MSLMSEKSPVNYLQRLIISSPDPLKSNDNHKLELQIQAYLKDQLKTDIVNSLNQYASNVEINKFGGRFKFSFLDLGQSKNALKR